MSEIENQSPALAWIAVALSAPQFFNDEMKKHVEVVNQNSTSLINEIDK